ncbi:MAG: hypothetical protein QOF51_1859 [Chloroflexota bacterium]|jgi:PPOX class probable F420-dependent enzyme|nr:hypothetical protein [Chloroflexota bacterium]
MELGEKERAFLERIRGAAMITLRPDGTPHAVRVGVALVDGKLWSSGTQDRVRTRHLRRDPRCTVFVFDTSFSSLTVEAKVTILEGPDAPEQSLRLFQAMQANLTPAPPPGKLVWAGEQKTFEEFLEIMRAEHRLIYEFEPIRVYGIY